MTDYHSSGAITLYDFTREQTDVVKQLLDTIKLIDPELPHPDDWNPVEPGGSPQRAAQLARKFTTSYSKLPAPSSLKWEYCLNTDYILSWKSAYGLDIHMDQVVYDTIAAALRFAYGKHLEDYRIFKHNNGIAIARHHTVVFDNYSQALEASCFLHNLRQLLVYNEISEAAGNNAKVVRLAFDLVHEHEYDISFEYTVRDHSHVMTIYNSGTLNADALAGVLQGVMKILDIDKVLGFEWAETTDKPIPWQWGGGACVLSRDNAVFMDTHSFVCHDGKVELERQALEGKVTA